MILQKIINIVEHFYSKIPILTIVYTSLDEKISSIVPASEVRYYYVAFFVDSGFRAQYIFITIIKYQIYPLILSKPYMLIDYNSIFREKFQEIYLKSPKSMFNYVNSPRIQTVLQTVPRCTHPQHSVVHLGPHVHVTAVLTLVKKPLGYPQQSEVPDQL